MSQAYQNPTIRIFGEGAVEQELPDLLKTFRPKRVLLVLGMRSFRSSPDYETLQRTLSQYETHEAPPVSSHPSVAMVEHALTFLRSRRTSCDVVLGIGGGSVLDVAKLLAALLPQRATSAVETYLAQRRAFRSKPLPVIAVPTTAGTGSEVTPYVSLETRTKQKVTLEHPWLFPRVALIDPRLTHSMPAYVTACTGFDAFCQAVESCWAKRRTPFSQTHALRAITLILGAFDQVQRDPHDREARAAMALASCEAGLAISQTRTTAVHAVSYPLTTLFGIAHGHACALTLASFIRFNAPSLANGQGTMLWHAMGVSSAEEAARLVERLMDAVALERSLRRLGVDRAGVSRIVEQGFRPDRVDNNPRALTPAALRKMLHTLY